MKVVIDNVPVYTIDEKDSNGFTVNGVHPQQWKWFNNCVDNFWKAQKWLQEEVNRERTKYGSD